MYMLLCTCTCRYVHVHVHVPDLAITLNLVSWVRVQLCEPIEPSTIVEEVLYPADADPNRIRF